jgi:hypothetical protein
LKCLFDAAAFFAVSPQLSVFSTNPSCVGDACAK